MVRLTSNPKTLNPEPKEPLKQVAKSPLKVAIKPAYIGSNPNP